MTLEELMGLRPPEQPRNTHPVGRRAIVEPMPHRLEELILPEEAEPKAENECRPRRAM
ncbi:MAG: hypothetical protein LBM23_04980 [Propionibacteriaceae bacterium]|jgi:hypothetical protein|nr:hypothetical protein [Propionibacteriaceae bacterium]